LAGEAVKADQPRVRLSFSLAGGKPMAQQILIDKLLMACVKQGASDIHITVGQPPVFRLYGRLRRLETKCWNRKTPWR